MMAMLQIRRHRPTTDRDPSGSDENMSLRQKTFWGLGLASVLALLAGTAAMLLPTSSHPGTYEFPSTAMSAPDDPEPVEDSAVHVTTIHEKRLIHYQKVALEQGVSQLTVEEEERNFMAAKYAAIGASVGVTKAEAEWREAKANLDAAIADVSFKQALTEAARRDRDRAEA